MIVTTREIQKRLADIGYDPGPLDGIRGRRTVQAIKQFQADHGLAVDGIVGPVTRSKLFGGGSASMGLQPDLPWYEEARRFLGLKEVSGGGDNRTIMDWARDLDIAYSGDDVPWCGLFVAHCIGSTLPEEELPANPLGARSWRKFGRPCEPTKGCILVFWRESLTSYKGHVGFYAGQDDAAYYVLGGNQSDSVSITRISRTRLLDARWPTTAVYGEQQVVELTPDSNPLSTDEA
ncbi:TIGR02594 family protein [Mangrovicella endophytica]|uniref:NlpC/P60 family protein n=1 Tax=Mangrovicella endophytica TaxID=2066697 RepID=UPI000C9E348A|nr:TIGR02594 family protein [Mangrovicella endophytica]